MLLGFWGILSRQVPLVLEEDSTAWCQANVQETIQIVQRGIEGLSTIDPDRLIFKIQLGTGESQHWAKVLDEAWDRFDADPPKRLAIVVADAPGDDHLRMSPLSERADQQVRGGNGCIISTR